MELIFFLLVAFVIAYLIRVLRRLGRVEPEPVYVMRRWTAERYIDERTEKGRWDADFEELDKDRRLEAERVQREAERERAERERARRETARLVADFERFKREHPEPPPYKAPPSSAEVFARLRGELGNL